MILSKHSKFNKYLLTAITLFSISTPISVSAQLSKVPNISGEVPAVLETNPITMPESYPKELIEHFDQNVDARSFIVIDSETNRVLAERAANTRYPIASMSKVAVAYLVYQAVAEGKIKLDDKITVPQEIEDTMSFNPEMSAMGLRANTEYTVEDLLAGIMLASGNDATSTLMWHLYGTEQEGVKAIRELLTSWGMTNFEFYTTSGIPNQYIPESMWVEGSTAESENQMSAADVALMAQHLVKDFPDVLKITSASVYVAQEGTDHEITMHNANGLLPGGAYEHPGVTGLKSGLTDAAGKNFVATGSENGREFIAVAMGVFDNETYNMSAYWEIDILLDKLAEFPDLYKDEALPTNLIAKPEETVVEEEPVNEESAVDIKATLAEQGISGENRRDNAITNFIKSIMNIFK